MWTWDALPRLLSQQLVQLPGIGAQLGRGYQCRKSADSTGSWMAPVHGENTDCKIAYAAFLFLMFSVLITELQNNLGWKGPLGACRATPARRSAN